LGQRPKVLLLTLILILLPPKGGLGAQPQGFDFVFLPEGHPVQSQKRDMKAFLFKVKTLGKEFPRPLLFF